MAENWFPELPENIELPQMMPEAGPMPVLDPGDIEEWGLLTGDRLYELLDADQAHGNLLPVPPQEEPMEMQEVGPEVELGAEPQAEQGVEPGVEGGAEPEAEEEEEPETNQETEPEANHESGGDGAIFKCEICSREFHTSNARNGHARKHKTTCQRCHVTFESNGRYEIHVRMNHGPTFTCKLCGQLSHDAKDIIIHILDHKELRKESSKVYGQIATND